MNLLDEMMAHAKEEFPSECCGLVVASGNKARIIRAKNLAKNPRQHFDLDPEAWLQLADHEEVIGVYHSHPRGVALPSLADKSGCEASGVPWHIVAYPSGDYRRIEPQGFEAPYLERPYVHGIHDCYAIVRDWYQREWGLDLPNFDRRDGWWERGEDLYTDNFESCGFVRVEGDPQVGDAFLIQVASRVANHAAIYLGDGRILHHVYGRLSTIDVWGGYWQKHSVAHLRHNSRMGTING